MKNAKSTFAFLTSILCVLANPSLLQADNWTVKPDPSSVPSIGSDLKFHLVLPVEFPDALSFAWPFPASERVPFAIVSGTRECTWKILDLKTGKISAAAQTGQLDDVVASPDLKYIAGSGIDRGGVCQVWSLTEKKLLLTLRPEQSSQPTAMGFHGAKDLFLSWVAYLQKTTLTESDPATGKSIRNFTLPLTIVDGGWSLSPGRKYAAILNSTLKSQSLDICDLDAGKIVGQSTVPKSNRPFANSMHPLATVFSRDGSRLAVLLEAGTANRLIQWDLATGKVEFDLTDFKFQTQPGSHEQGPMLEILPGNKAVRISHFIYDLKTGEQTGTLHHPQGDSEFFLLVQMLTQTKALIVTTPGVTTKSATFATKSVDPVND